MLHDEATDDDYDKTSRKLLLEASSFISDIVYGKQKELENIR